MPRKPSAGGKRTAPRSPILPATNPATDDHVTPEESVPFPIVTVGASAGGLDAFKRFLEALPPETGMGFVVIQHLVPSHESLLATILARSTKMPVQEAQQHMPVEPNRVYVIPPGANMVYGEGLLQLGPRTETSGQHRPIDHFMRSLAEEHGYKAIGVVLSGTGSDGTLGLQEIKTAGGITFAQDDSAEQTGMPRSAVAAGCVDFVLPPGDIAHELARIAKHPLVAPPPSELEKVLDRNKAPLTAILELLRDNFGVDFGQYKRNTLSRRITRRMLLQKVTTLQDYARLLQSTPAEVEALYHDILINVTSFFRNPESYEALKKEVFPRLVRGRSRNENLRVWTLGCSTGEEAYSVAMTYTEFAEETGARVPLQVFATDVNGVGIEKARSGLYPQGIEQDLTAERLQRFFTKVDGSYRVAKPIRDMCIFARQNVLADPPFSHLDLVACRNLLIYLEPALQQRLIPVLHFALRDGGILWLGSSETIGASGGLFDVLDPRNRIYLRKPGRANVGIPFRATARIPPIELEPRSFPVAIVPNADRQNEADRLVLSRYAPPGVVIDPNFDILQFRGDTSPYLKPAAGRASLNLLKMLREGLLLGVRNAVERARRDGNLAREQGLHFKSDGAAREVGVVAMPLSEPGGDGRVLLLFEDKASAAVARAPAVEARKGPKKKVLTEHEVEQLRQELTATREYLQSVIEQQEAANEELQAANEEVQSTNEELQSVNEELETSKEEIESTNEELSSLNEELQQRNVELAESNNDFSNLLASVKMPIVLLDRKLRIRRFTPAAGEVLNLIPGDVGRPIRNINLPPDMRELEAILLQVMTDVSALEREVRDERGRWHLLRVRQYRTPEGQIEGAVVILVDIDAIKRSTQALTESEGRFHNLADSAPVLIWVNDLERCRFVNRAFEHFVGTDEASLGEAPWGSFVHSDDRAQFTEAYTEAFERRGPFELIVRFRRADGTYRWMKCVGVPRFTEIGEFLGYVGSAVDISELKDAESALRDADRAKNEFLSTLGHELRNPLAAMRNAMYLLAPQARKDEAGGRSLEVIERQMGNMVRMVDDLLDISRITQGKIQLRVEPLDLAAAARHAVSATEHERARSKQSIEAVLPDDPIWIEADPSRLDQILGNLLGNASKFTPEGGHIRLTVARARSPEGEELAEIRVRDDGIGIAPEMLSRIFDLFVQGTHPANRMRSGVGIGLTLTRRLVELHGGSIHAQSEGPSTGSEFVVRMPLHSRVPTVMASAEKQGMGAKVDRLLLVDDNRDSVDAMASWLGTVAEEVRVAYDGKEAIAVAQSFHPRVVLLDIGLPDMSGYDVARRIREMDGMKDAYLVAFTGFGRPEDIEEAQDAGIDEHITKPADPDRLMALIGRLAVATPA